MKDSVEQLMAGCVDETCVRSLRLHYGTPGSIEYNELRRCLSLAIVIVGTKSAFVYQRSVDINEQLSRRNSLNALCYQSNFHRRLCAWELDIQWIFIVDTTNKQPSFSLCFLISKKIEMYIDNNFDRNMHVHIIN